MRFKQQKGQSPRSMVRDVFLLVSADTSRARLCSAISLQAYEMCCTLGGTVVRAPSRTLSRKPTVFGFLRRRIPTRRDSPQLAFSIQTHQGRGPTGGAGCTCSRVICGCVLLGNTFRVVVYSVRERKCWCVPGCAAPVGDDLPILRIAEAYKVPRARVFIPEIRLYHLVCTRRHRMFS